MAGAIICIASPLPSHKNFNTLFFSIGIMMAGHTHYSNPHHVLPQGLPVSLFSYEATDSWLHDPLVSEEASFMVYLRYIG